MRWGERANYKWLGSRDIAQKGCDQYSDGRLPPSFTIIACGEIGADAASTSVFPTLDCATVEADQTPNAVAATIAKPMISSLRIGLSLHPV